MLYYRGDSRHAPPMIWNGILPNSKPARRLGRLTADLQVQLPSASRAAASGIN